MDTRTDIGSDVRAIFERIRAAQRRHALDWSVADFAPAKAHVAGLYALLAYAAVPELELRRSVRVKVVPSELYARVLAAGRPVDLKAVVAALGMDEFQVFAVSNRRAVAVGVRAPDAVFLALRGTASLWDALIDLRTWTLRPYLDTPMRFHRGFYVTISSLRWQIIRELQKWGRERPLVICGHSLGGAMAGILNALNEFRGYWMGLEAMPAVSCYSYGMPRYANAAALHARPYPFHVYHTLDPVPRMPPPWFGYAVPQAPEYSLQSRLAAEARAARPRLGLRVRHHKMESYLHGMNAITRLE